MAMGHHQRPVGRSTSVARIGILVVAFAAVASGAHAAGGGTAMPWDGPLQTIADSITGPVAKAVGVIAIAVTGLGVAFAEGGSWVRRGPRHSVWPGDRVHRVLIRGELFRVHGRGGLLDASSRI